MKIDVCNGDADGLCAVVQWRLNSPEPSQLVTGIKRDIALLERVQAQQGDHVLVCDISMQRNLKPLMRLLRAGVKVAYFDHHKVDDIPVHPLLETHINTARNQCTSLLLDQHLAGKFRAWAVVGAFGDNLTDVADGLAISMGLSFRDRQRLQSLGEAINYNAYGDSLDDVHIRPAHLYEKLVAYSDPLKFLDCEPIGQALVAWREEDLQRAQALAPFYEDASVCVYLLPDAPWSRRVSGSWGNLLATKKPSHAHAVLRALATGGFLVSVRAPLFAPVGAADFCRAFGGDGRAGAAGIDQLAADQLERFIHAFSKCPWGVPPVASPRA